MKKKIIFITEALWVGGIEIALANLLNSFDYDKYDVTCLVLRASLEVSDRINNNCRLIVSDRVKTVSFSEKYKYNNLFCLMEEPQNASKFRLFIWKCLKFFLRAPEARLYSAYIKKQLKNEHFDTAVIYSDRVAELALRAVNADKFLMFYHHGAMRKEYHDEIGYKKSKKIIAVSKELSEKLKKYRPRFASKIICINNVVDVNGIKEKGKEKPDTEFSKDVFNIVSCGRLNKDKGFDLAIKACKSLLEKGLNIKWYVLGGGPEEASLKNQAKECGVKDTIIFLGSCINPYPYMKQADLFVQSSRIEAFGLTITEALALGVPVVSTKTDGGTEIITDGENGILCDISWESIESAVERAINDPAFLKKLKCGAQSTDFEKSNSDIMNRLYEEID